MITRLTGQLSALTPPSAAAKGQGRGQPCSAEIEPLDPGGRPAGLAYEVLLPAYLAAAYEAAPARGPVTLHTRQHLETTNQGASFIPRLTGFATPAEREFFELFTSVKGLGAKKALKALTQPPSEVAAAIARGDAKALTALPEIGKRLAETIIAELAGKADRFVDPGIDAAGEITPKPAAMRTNTNLPAGPLAEAVEALVNLGEQRAEAERRVEKAMADNPDPATVDDVLVAVFRN